MPKKIRHRPIFTATNNHDKQAGMPPFIKTDDTDRYFAYFENERHQQFIFVYDYATHTGTLWSGVAGWDHPFEVINGKAINAKLTYAEKNWFKTCLNVVEGIEQGRKAHQRLMEERANPPKPVVSSFPPREEFKASMGHLYDRTAHLVGLENCSREEFVAGWTGLRDLLERIEIKHLSKQQDSEEDSS